MVTIGERWRRSLETAAHRISSKYGGTETQKRIRQAMLGVHLRAQLAALGPTRETKAIDTLVPEEEFATGYGYVLVQNLSAQGRATLHKTDAAPGSVLEGVLDGCDKHGLECFLVQDSVPHPGNLRYFLWMRPKPAPAPKRSA